MITTRQAKFAPQVDWCGGGTAGTKTACLPRAVSRPLGESESAESGTADVAAEEEGG